MLNKSGKSTEKTIKIFVVSSRYRHNIGVFETSDTRGQCCVRMISADQADHISLVLDKTLSLKFV